MEGTTCKGPRTRYSASSWSFEPLSHACSTHPDRIKPTVPRLFILVLCGLSPSLSARSVAMGRLALVALLGLATLGQAHSRCAAAGLSVLHDSEKRSNAIPWPDTGPAVSWDGCIPA